MKVIKFDNYQEYKSIQIEGYSSKVDTHSWVDTYSIRALTSYINEYNPNVKFGLCHGTRRGVEQNHFMETFRTIGKDVQVTGTEIAPDAANRFPNTIEWDFHEVKDEWIKNVDFIYSNSFDHSYKPKECLDSWMSCLNDKGLCILEWNKDSENNPRAMDPFAASFEEYKQMIEEKYEILTILQNDKEKCESNTGKDVDRYYFVIKNKDLKNETN